MLYFCVYLLTWVSKIFTAHARIYTNNLGVCVCLLLCSASLFQVLMNLRNKKGGVPGRVLRVSFLKFPQDYLGFPVVHLVLS